MDVARAVVVARVVVVAIAITCVVAVAAGAAGGSAAPAASTSLAGGQVSTPTELEPTSTLIVQDAATDEVVLAIPVEEGTTVALTYTHSVEKTPVRDVYEVSEGKLAMVRMEFDSFGAGLPSGANVTETDDGRLAFDPGGSYEELYVQPGEVAGHRLVVGDGEHDLVALSGGRTVRVHLVDACVAGPGSESARSADSDPDGDEGTVEGRVEGNS